ncbi:uncharacterized protein LOC135107123 [Scylla paramamosain]|uniref:uncharacterized protein LOC135107123 n=1 Tax=Scylla paramamosain TaxID=85552 RepID=UPI003082BA0A
MASQSRSCSNQGSQRPEGLSSQSSDPMLPTQRVRMIVSSCPGVEKISEESLHLITRATELFVQSLTQEVHSQAADASKLCYEDVAGAVHSLDHLKFLRDIIPQKITWAEAQKLMENHENNFEGFF